MFNAPHPSIFAALSSAAALFLIAAPVAASAETPDQTTIKVDVEQRKGKTVYCAARPFTGSPVPNRTCLTREEWKVQGVHVLEPNDVAKAKSEKTPS